MIEIKSDIDVEKTFKGLVEEAKPQVREETFKELVINYRQMINSSEAIDFTERMNRYFQINEMMDEEGNLIQIDRPIFLFDGLNGANDLENLNLTAAEDRWIRADQLYGNNIFGRLGLKYTTE